MERLLSYATSYHKRYGVVSIQNGRLSLQFFDGDFSNALCIGGNIQECSPLPLPSRHMEKDMSKWWFNGHLLCNTHTPWKPRCAQELASMIEECIPMIPSHLQIHCVLNVRDYPWLKEDSSSPFPFLHQPLHWMYYKCPIAIPLSFYGGKAWKDKLIPPPEHWNVWETTSTLRQCKKTISKAVFRGTLTGRYMDGRNIRLQICSLKHESIDAGLTAWTERERVREFKNGVLYIDLPPPSQPLVRAMSLEEQASYKIVLYIPGHVASNRLAWQLCSGCIVLSIQDPSCQAPDMWFHEYLHPTDICTWKKIFHPTDICTWKYGFTPSDRTVYYECEAWQVEAAVQWLLTMQPAPNLTWAKKTFSKSTLQCHLATQLF